ncbi:ABC transporter, permease protein, putative [Nitrosococcus halophilus Nc 4]|uniref:ABC transporter, permease protein, putative n=1 Tax=Nitrosococcus halophilus (strain Nc4) TaxID=472759 RepID=D5BW91_NITHN|nr:ABC transporter permease subunit [Nitrosococcus halophilus]ADE13741.1 ABC transporter, permease protein, putative [Nitrosococcus halophilus Nc 4]
MMVFTLALHELRRLFLSPLAWATLAVSQILLGYMFLSQVAYFLQVQSRLMGLPEMPGVTEVVAMPLFQNAAVVMLLIVPLMTMRLVADERRSHTLALLFSAPLSMTEIVLGKYLGTLAFFAIMTLLLTLMPLSLLIGGTLDLGLLAAGLLGLGLLLASFTAIGLFLSCLTQQATLAAVGSFGVLLLLWIIDWAGSSGLLAKGSEVLNYLSLLQHYQALLKGQFNSSDIIYYLLIIITFLTLSIRRLDADRLPH